MRILYFLAAISISAYGQDVSGAEQNLQERNQKSKLEQFKAETGVVIIMGSSAVGSIKPQLGNDVVSVETREFINAATGSKEYGVFIQFNDYDNRSIGSSYIDFDEIESLIKGIEYITNVKEDVTKLKKFQAEYKTQSGFKVFSFGSTAKRESALEVRNGKHEFLDAVGLAKFKELLQAPTTLS